MEKYPSVTVKMLFKYIDRSYGSFKLFGALAIIVSIRYD